MAKKVINLKEDPFESIIESLQEEHEKGNIKQLIIVMETNEEDTMSAAVTDSLISELGLLELAKLDALYRSGHEE